MDSFDFFKELILALKAELIRYRFPACIAAVVVLFSILVTGFNWKNYYVSTAILEVDDSNIIQPLLRGAAEFADTDRIDEASELMDSKQLLELIGTRLDYIDEDTTSIELGEILRVIRSAIVIEPTSKRSNQFSISYSSRDPQLSFDAATVVVDEFVQFQQRSRRMEGEYAYEFITKQAETYKERLANAEGALQKFKAASLDSNEGTVQKRITQLEGEIQELELGIQEASSKINSTKLQLNSESKYLGVQAKVYSLRQQKFALEESLTQLRMQYQDSYPDVVTVRQQLAGINLQIDIEMANSDLSALGFSNRGNLDSNPEILFDELRKQVSLQEVEYKAKKQRLDSLEKLLLEEKRKADIVSANQAQSAELMRDYTVTKQVYEEMLGRKENAELSVAIQKDGRGLTFRVVEDPGYPFYPTGLTFIHFLIAAPILGFGFPVGILIALIILDQRVRTKTTLSIAIQDSVPLLGICGHYHTAFADRVLKKDIVILSGVLALTLAVYTYSAFIGLTQ